MIESFPLCWPENWKRTPPWHRTGSRFRLTLYQARKDLQYEVAMLGASRLIISTNLPLRRDGEFHASAKNPDDPGVAVYFTYKHKQMCFACDLHPLVRENLNAIAKTINALRGIERWGASDMMERALSKLVKHSGNGPEPGARGSRVELPAPGHAAPSGPGRRSSQNGGAEPGAGRSVEAVMNSEL